MKFNENALINLLFIFPETWNKRKILYPLLKNNRCGDTSMSYKESEKGFFQSYQNCSELVI